MAFFFLENGVGYRQNAVTIDNALLNASRHSPADKMEELITFALSHTCLYLAESYDERDDKSDAANTFDISCDGGGYSSSISAITISVLDTSDAACC